MTRHLIASYSNTAKILHWAVGLIVLGLIPIGIVMADLSHGALQDQLFALHESFGVTLLALMFVRVIVRVRDAPAPAPSLTRSEEIMSRAIHHALYALLLLTPLIGWFALSAYGLGPSFFGLVQMPVVLGRSEALSKLLFSLHGFCGFFIGALVILHVLGIVRHSLSKRTDIVARMLWQRH